ncbi:TIGR03564 family F420-dependent LLM class oxidoreductase [Amycolatopsis nigrescens]|uniref:TIGR03564 family F420-dependent LLM class oxidoreductase n=1 Tax=Amycolatopsis nigrescens TaxID=381445 RepID=UPI00037E3796|nr:TIGR03564 family F420-dependent LLM class oxidoreductase [Amycolatopsis nigrescens]
MTIGVALPAGLTEAPANHVEHLIELTREAADAGLGSAWFSQQFATDAITIAALAGRAVPGIAVGTSVVPIYPRHPILLSGLAKTAQAATGGRFTLGVGLGAKNLLEPAYGVPYPPPIKHLREYLAALEPLLAGQNTFFEGETVASRPSWPTAVPGAEPEIPVVVAAMGPQALRVTGELADGTLPYLAGPRALGEYIVPEIVAAAEKAGRRAPRIVAAVPVVVTADVPRARELAAEQTALYDTIPSYQRVLEWEGVQKAAELVVVGDEETVAKELKRYFDAGATEIVLTETALTGSADRVRTWRLGGALARS